MPADTTLQNPICPECGSGGEAQELHRTRSFGTKQRSLGHKIEILYKATNSRKQDEVDCIKKLHGEVLVLAGSWPRVIEQQSRLGKPGSRKVFLSGGENREISAFAESATYQGRKTISCGGSKGASWVGGRELQWRGQKPLPQASQ